MYRFDPKDAIYEVDPRRVDLAREFRDNPQGPFSHELQCVLNRMRSGPLDGKWVLYPIVETGQWALAQIPAERADPLIIHNDVLFDARSDAEWHVFKLRWQEITGQPLEVSE
nr:hypothetical protein [uncultured Roseovarius sp.]